MATLNFKFTWTLNGLEVPLEKKAVSCVDPENLGVGNVDEINEMMSLVSFQTSADMR